ASAGHYTAYTRHPLTQAWHYLNDETCSEQVLQQEDYRNAYILFYRGTGQRFDRGRRNMALVAYASSDSESDEKEEKEDGTGDSLFASLPRPSKRAAREGDEEGEIEGFVRDHHFKGDEEPPPPKKKLRPPVRISIPTLIPDGEIEEEDKESNKKEIEGDEGRRSGLMALLPPPANPFARKTKEPKTVTATTTSLVPRSVAPQKKGKVEKPVVRDGDDEAEEEAEEGEAMIDFFSLDRSSSPSPPPTYEPIPLVPLAPSCTFPKESIVPGPAVEVGPPGPPSPPVEMPGPSPSLKLNEEALVKLEGRGRRRGEEIEIMDVKADDVMPPIEQILTKQLSQEVKSFGGRRGPGPSSQQRRKHQITYLAHQAKERELDLKNEWAQNRMTRRQTQANETFLPVMSADNPVIKEETFDSPSPTVEDGEQVHNVCRMPLFATCLSGQDEVQIGSPEDCVLGCPWSPENAKNAGEALHLISEELIASEESSSKDEESQSELKLEVAVNPQDISVAATHRNDPCAAEVETESTTGTIDYICELDGESSDHKECKTVKRERSAICRPGLTFSCIICGCEFRLKSALADHIKSTHSGERPFKCSSCNKTFTSEVNLRVHTRCHSDEEPYRCDICANAFKWKGNLLKHMTLVHSDERPFKCDICGETYKLKYVLDRHKIRHQERRFECGTCSTVFFQEYDLRRHEVCHSDAKPYRCEECGREFKRKRGLLYHQTSHSEVKSFVCEFCGKAFKRKKELLYHHTSHSEVKPFKCEFCGKGFKWKKDVISHCRAKHKDTSKAREVVETPLKSIEWNVP
ncbi:unnamed protein product, partial [Darwinula stevensoni]